MVDPLLAFGPHARESLLFVEPAPGQPAIRSLLFPPRGDVVVESATNEIAYVETVDFIVDHAHSRLTRTPASHSPVTTLEYFTL